MASRRLPALVNSTAWESDELEGTDSSEERRFGAGERSVRLVGMGSGQLGRQTPLVSQITEHALTVGGCESSTENYEFGDIPVERGVPRTTVSDSVLGNRGRQISGPSRPPP